MAAVYVLAWLLRFVYVLTLRASPLADVPVLDELYHVEWARALAAGDWIGGEVFFRAPLYPYVLGATFAAFHGSLLAARLVQVTYSALTPVVVLLIARRLTTGRRALVAGCVAAAYPFFLYFTNELLIESLVVLLNALVVLAIVRADEVPSWARWIVAGVAVGLAAIARPSVLVVVPFVVLWMWWRARRGGEPEGMVGPRRRARVGLIRGGSALRVSVARVACLVLGIGVVIGPVTIRNYALEKDFVLIASQGGVNFFIGNNAESDGVSAVMPVLGEAWEYEQCVRIAEREEGRALKPSEVSGFWYRKGREFVWEHPEAAAALFARKFVLFWNRFEHANNKDIYYFANMSPLYKAVSWLSFGLVAPLAVLGAVVSRRGGAPALIVLFVLAYMAGVILYFVNARFRLPIVPFLIVLAVVGFFWLVDRLRERDVRALVRGAALVVAVALFSNADLYGTHAGDRPQTHNTIGLAYASKGRHEEAVAEFLRALELAPAYAKAMNNMGLSLEALGREAEARAAYERAIAVNPTLATARNNLGAVCRRAGDIDGAVRWFTEAIRLDPFLYQAHANLAGTLMRLGDRAGAEEHYRAAVAANPAFKEAWLALGVLMEESGRLGDAIAAYTRAVEIDPGDALARNSLGIALAMSGQYREALMELRLALETSPGEAGIAGNIQMVEELMGRQGVSRTPPAPPSP